MSEKKENVHAGHRQRVKKRFIEHGFDGMEPHQVLEMLLFYAIPRKDTNQLAHQLLDRYGTLGGICDTPIDILEKDFGLSENAAVLLKMVPELARAYEESKLHAKYINKTTAIDIIRPKFIGATSERVVLALADAKQKLILCDAISVGSVTASEIPTRKIVDLALRHNARYVYLAHNHPSEVCSPSRTDLEATEKVSEMLYNIGVILIDHLIITTNEYFSIRSHKNFSKLFADKYGI